jgi:hypothetical protein
MFRRHLRAIISFPIGILALYTLIWILVVLANSQTLNALLIALGMPIVVVCVLVAITVLCFTQVEDRSSKPSGPLWHPRWRPARW